MKVNYENIYKNNYTNISYNKVLLDEHIVLVLHNDLSHLLKY